MYKTITLSLVVTTEYHNTRLDKFVTTSLINLGHVGYSREAVQKLIAQQKVTINGIATPSKKAPVSQEDKVEVQLEEKEEVAKEGVTKKEISRDSKHNLEILYEDEHLLVINKAAGLLVHHGRGSKDQVALTDILIEKYGENRLSNMGDRSRIGIVHRLDKNTSGLMIVAKSNKAHYLLSKALAKHEIKRTYTAFIYGIISPPIGIITANVMRCNKDRTKIVTSYDETKSKTAITHYRILKSFKYDDDKKKKTTGFSMVECKLETGRTHQIRVHMLSKGYPIIGDEKYTAGFNFNFQSIPKNITEYVQSFPRQALHSTQLEFLHPMLDKEMKFTTELPGDMSKLLKIL